MKAIILAAGYATRLYPLTLDKPKALLPIHGKPIIDYLIDELNTIGEVNEIVVVSNHRFIEHFKEWEKVLQNPIPITILDDGSTTQDNRLGAIGDIDFTIKQSGIDEDTLIICGDNYFTFRLKDFVDYFHQKDGSCVIAKTIDDIELLKRIAVISIDEKDKIVEFEEKPQVPKSNLGALGAYLYTKETLPLFETYLQEGNLPDAPGYFVQWLHKREKVYAYRISGDCIDVGTVQAYEEINR